MMVLLWPMVHLAIPAMAMFLVLHFEASGRKKLQPKQSRHEKYDSAATNTNTSGRQIRKSRRNKSWEVERLDQRLRPLDQSPKSCKHRKRCLGNIFNFWGTFWTNIYAILSNLFICCKSLAFNSIPQCYSHFN